MTTIVCFPTCWRIRDALYLFDSSSICIIREYDSITRAEMAKSVLESEGIFATIRNEYMSAIYPIGTMPAEIVVREEDAEWASALLRSMDGEDAAK